jgi:ApeA N-terminal domain 1
VRKGLHLGNPSLNTGLWLLKSPVSCHVWLPHAAELMQPAVLTCKPGRSPMLDLGSRLIPCDATFSPSAVVSPVVHGITEQNLPFTMVDVSGEDHGPMPGMGGQELHASYCLVGAHVTGTDLRFSRIRFATTLLASFIGASPFVVDDGQLARQDLSDLYFELEAGTISFGFETELGGWGGQARPWIEMRITEPLSLREWIDTWVQPLNRLVTFATGKASDLVYLVRLEPAQHGDHSHDAECAVLGSGLSGDVDSIRAERSHRFGESWITAQDVGTVWPSWTAVLASLEVAIELYLETVIRRGELSARHRFLNLVQAAESVHSAKHRETKIPEADYRKQLADAKVALTASAIAKPEKEFLRGHLVPGVGNGVRLDERLNDLRARLHEHFQPTTERPPWLPQDRDGKTWGEVTAHARNLVSHGRSDVPNDWLRSASDTLALIVENEILDSLGLDAETCHALLHRRN